MATSLNTGLHKVFYVPLTTGNVTDIYKSIAWEMGLITERNLAALYRSICSSGSESFVSGIENQTGADY